MSDRALPAHPLQAPLQALYADHHGWLLGWLRGRLGSHADAADLAQDTFVRILRAHVDADLREPRAYLATVARRLVANFYRDQAIEQAYLDLLAAQPQAETPSAEEQYLIREALLEIDCLLDGLGGKVKQAFLLAQFEELPYAEIAARLGISLRSVNNYVARAMAHCCQALP